MAIARPAFECCGVRIDAHTLDSAIETLLSPADPGNGRSVHLCNAYTLSLARRDPEFLRRLNQSTLNLPDGMPIIWVGCRLGLGHLDGRVYGPDLMLGVIDAGREVGLRHFLYGATGEVNAMLERELRRRFPGVDIVGRESPPFRPLGADEHSSFARRLRDLDPDLVWVPIW